MSQVVLDYHDVLLRSADVDLLRGPCWLNDQVIAFYFEYLRCEKFAALHDAVAFLPGATTFLLLHMDPHDAAAVFQPLQLERKQLILFAVNDNPDVEQAAGGSHWSLLCYHRPSNTFRHYDSMHQHNSSVAWRIAEQVAALVAPDQQQQQQAWQYVPEQKLSPQQQNGYDCGLYVLAVAEQLAAWLAEDKPLEPEEQQLPQLVTQQRVPQLRHELLQLVSARAAAAASRRS